MPEGNVVFAAALSVLLLASCGSQEPKTAENEAADAATNALQNASPSDLGQPNGSDEPSDDSVPPPDAVSHPDGYLPNAGDLPAPGGPEPTTDSPPSSKEPPPATEDEYIRNRQAGG
ncbi:MAG TPA: hypothetical protein VFZ91_13640 [Allosphingosinicella sp.]